MQHLRYTAALFVLVVVLVNCGGAGAGGGDGTTPDVVSVDLAGADGYAQVWNSPAKLVKIENNVPTEVEWTATDGTTVSVPVSQAKMVGTDYMLLSYTHNEETHAAVAARSTGELVEIPAPANWDRIRNKAGKSYYVSDGRILELDPATGATTAMSRVEDTVPGSAYIAMPANGTPFAFDSTFKKSYPAPDNPVDISGRSSATRFHEAMVYASSSGTSKRSIVYDPGSDTYYILDWQNDNYRAIELASDGLTREEPVTSASWPFGTARRVGSGLPSPANSVFTDGYGNAVYEATISGGAVSLSSTATDYNAGIFVEHSMLVDDKYYYQTNPGGAGTMQIRELDISTGTERKLTDVGDNIQKWEVTGGVLFWIDDSGSWEMDLDTGAVSEFQASDVKAVTQ